MEQKMETTSDDLMDDMSVEESRALLAMSNKHTAISDSNSAVDLLFLRRVWTIFLLLMRSLRYRCLEHFVSQPHFFFVSCGTKKHTAVFIRLCCLY